MPTYEYKCNSCGAMFEKFQSMNDVPVSHCVSCGRKVERLIGTGGGIILKGSGFHANDYPAASTADTATGASCGREFPCCGRDSFCGKPGCNE
ncbi:MAG: zinc ribbon domain-containing protein [Chitinivibrionales bacterium]|nr:zinc ribbon domain-containing protein [Chitinivibrionales bacterium]MBD3357057.1 zinc ribbon domain-containing protein [Chitinivibrionales bacterium]